MSLIKKYGQMWPDLTRLLYPSGVAVIGASIKPNSISGQPLAHMIAGRYEGKLYPVNPPPCQYDLRHLPPVQLQSRR